MIVALLNRSAAADSDVAFWAEAANQQSREVADVWGVPYVPVVFYSSTDNLPASDFGVLSILPSVDEPGALGYHTDVGGALLAEVKFTGPDTSITISHEVLEQLVDPTVDRWAPYDANHEQATEGADRVEGDSYPVFVSVAGEMRSVMVSNYLLPRAFGEGTGGPFDKLGLVSSQTEIRPGGYAILRDITTGKVSNTFARTSGPRVVAGPLAGAVLAEKLAKRGSRLLRRLRG